MNSENVILIVLGTGALALMTQRLFRVVAFALGGLPSQRGMPTVSRAGIGQTVASCKNLGSIGLGKTSRSET